MARAEVRCTPSSCVGLPYGAPAPTPVWTVSRMVHRRPATSCQKRPLRDLFMRPLHPRVSLAPDTASLPASPSASPRASKPEESKSMQIGIIGAGMIGSTVARLWADAGHTVRFATRHPDRLDGL